MQHDRILVRGRFREAGPRRPGRTHARLALLVVTRGASPSRADGHAGVDENERLFGVCGCVVPAVCSGFGADHLGVRRDRLGPAAAPAAPAHHHPVTAADHLAAAGDDDLHHDHDDHDAAQLGFLGQRLRRCAFTTRSSTTRRRRTRRSIRPTPRRRPTTKPATSSVKPKAIVPVPSTSHNGVPQFAAVAAIVAAALVVLALVALIISVAVVRMRGPRGARGGNIMIR